MGPGEQVSSWPKAVLETVMCLSGCVCQRDGNGSSPTRAGSSVSPALLTAVLGEHAFCGIGRAAERSCEICLGPSA